MPPSTAPQSPQSRRVRKLYPPSINTHTHTHTHSSISCPWLWHPTNQYVATSFIHYQGSVDTQDKRAEIQFSNESMWITKLSVLVNNLSRLFLDQVLKTCFHTNSLFSITYNDGGYEQNPASVGIISWYVLTLSII